MRSAAQRAFVDATGRHSSGSIRRLIGRTVPILLIATVSGCLLWLVWIYGNGLRDPRYFDGWVLAGAMGLQLGFHIAMAMGRLAPKSAMRWKRIHIYIGYLLIAAFISHSDFALPDTGFEWALWSSFVAVTLSGIWGTYLAWFIKARRRNDEEVSYDRLPSLRAEISHEVETVVARINPNAPQLALPGLPHDAWIADLYATRLKDFFGSPHNASAHVFGSQRPLRRLTDEIDSLAAYVDQHGREKLAEIMSLVIEKDRLDFLSVYLWLNRVWLLVHVPVTYALIVLSVVHILVVYAFSSGAW